MLRDTEMLDEDALFFDPPVADLASFAGTRSTGRKTNEIQQALKNFEKYFNKPEGTATIEEVEATPGGIEEWCKEDVLDIVVGKGDKRMDLIS